MKRPSEKVVEGFVDYVREHWDIQVERVYLDCEGIWALIPENEESISNGNIQSFGDYTYFCLNQDDTIDQDVECGVEVTKWLDRSLVIWERGEQKDLPPLKCVCGCVFGRCSSWCDLVTGKHTPDAY